MLGPEATIVLSSHCVKNPKNVSFEKIAEFKPIVFNGKLLVGSNLLCNQVGLMRGFLLILDHRANYYYCNEKRSKRSKKWIESIIRYNVIEVLNGNCSQDSV